MLAAIDAAVAEIAAGKVDAKRVSDIRDNARYNLLMGLETHADVAGALAYTAGVLGVPDALEIRARALTKVTPPDLVAFAKKHLIEKNKTTLVFTVDVSKKEGAR